MVAEHRSPRDLTTNANLDIIHSFLFIPYTTLWARTHTSKMFIVLYNYNSNLILLSVWIIGTTSWWLSIRVRRASAEWPSARNILTSSPIRSLLFIAIDHHSQFVSVEYTNIILSHTVWPCFHHESYDDCQQGECTPALMIPNKVSSFPSYDDMSLQCTPNWPR